MRGGDDAPSLLLEPRTDAEGRRSFEYAVVFPQPGTTYVFDWHAEF